MGSHELGWIIGFTLVAVFVLGMKVENRRWKRVMDGMKTMRFGHKMAKVCRICAPKAKVDKGQLMFACPHGDVVPNKTKRHA